MGLFRSQGNAVVYSQSTQPTNPNIGDQWNNTSTFQSSLWNGSAWVGIVNAQATITVGGVSTTIENAIIARL